MIIVRLLLTALIVIAAVFGVSYVWTTYVTYPWTRDARVRADVVEVASYVSGVVTDLAVVDNQAVTAGDPLIQIDRADYQLAVQEARSSVRRAQAESQLQTSEARRLTALQQRDDAAISAQQLEQSQLQAQEAQASLQSAQNQLQQANLALQRTTITAPATGHVANLTIDVGDYATAGAPLIAVVDESSFRIEAFFMETKLPAIAIGAPARIRLMASDAVLDGTVEGITRAVADGQQSTGNSLQNPNDSFPWIRLARRIPVQVSIDEMPDDVPLVSGATATVILEPEGDPDENEDSVTDRWFERLRTWGTALVTRLS